MRADAELACCHASILTRYLAEPPLLQINHRSDDAEAPLAAALPT